MSISFLTKAFATGGEDAEAPQTLDYYLQRLPAKSISQVLKDQGLSSKNDSQSVINTEELTKDVAAGPSPALIHKIDHLLESARQSHAPSAEINLLQDLRDLAGGAATPKESEEYVTWRLEHLKWFARSDGLMAWEKPKVDTNALIELDAKIASASPALLPHWIYLKGAYYYKNLNDTESEACFDRVLKEFPKSARAETALFMKARCRLSQSVPSSFNDAQSKKEPQIPKEEAAKLFNQYLTDYPNGRYRNDVLGWLGGAAYRSGDYAGAISYYIQQIENKNHPEDIPEAVVMVEKCLYHLRDTDSPDIDHIAQHPDVAMALTYFAINSAPEKRAWYEDPNDVSTSNANLKKWRSQVLPKLATAVLAEKDRYRGQLGRNRYFAILAHAASDQGDQEEALKLLKLGNKSDCNDDYDFVQALVLQRAGKLPQAVDAYRDFLKRFPESPLATGAHYRMALALHDLHQDGDALLELASMRGNQIPFVNPPDSYPPSRWGASESSNTVSAINIDYSGAPEQEIDQTMDALLNFAPLPSLAMALRGKDKEHEQFRSDLESILRERALACEDFKRVSDLSGPYQDQRITQLGDLIKGIPKVAGAEKASNASQIAEGWNSDPIKLSLVSPLDDGKIRNWLFLDDGLNASSYRKTNGGVLSYTNADEELEARNPWKHAMAWWQTSLQSDPSASTAPQALWNKIKAERKTVEISPYTQQRAIDTKAQDQVRQQYNELISKYPDSEEAKKDAAYWNFPTQEEIQKCSSDYEVRQLAYAIRGNWAWESFTRELKEKLGFSNDDRDYISWTQLCEELSGLPDAVKSLDQKGFAAKVSDLLKRAEPQATTMEQMPVINCLEDLKQLAQLPSLDPTVRDDYIHLRMGILCASELAWLGSDFSKNKFSSSDEELHRKIQQLVAQPASQPIRDFIDFLNLSLTANHMDEFSARNLYRSSSDDALTYQDRDYPLLASQAENFLLKYPASPKREAAMVLRLRGLDLASRIKAFSNTIPWPQANSWAGDYAPLFYQRVPFDSMTFEKSLADYNKEFPNGSYRNAVLSYRADVALWSRDWGNFLDRISELKDQGGPEFETQIADELASFFIKLDDDSLRATMLAEILKRPAARGFLKAYLDAGGLPYLKDYLYQHLKG